MQSLRCTRSLKRLLVNYGHIRNFGATAATLQATEGVPWFVDQTPVVPQSFRQRPLPPHFPARPEPDAASVAPVPEDAPEVIKYLHAQLMQSPHLEKSRLVASAAVLPAPGPPLPDIKPHGRRRRGGTYAGETGYDATSGGLWSWVIMGQVKEGTENRGSIESVVRLVRKTLLKHEPPVPLPPKSRRQSGSEWVMIDAGSFAVHIVSKGAREKYFNQAAW